MKKWMISAIVYLLVVVGAYMVYASVTEEQVAESHEENSHNEENVKGTGHTGNEPNEEDGHSDEEASHAHGEAADEKDEVAVSLTVNENILNLTLENSEGKPVENLEVNHEKLLHLIVVDEHLDQYYHLHPEQTGAGQFQVSKELPDGSYKAFVDIKPTDLHYAVRPIKFTIGSPKANGHGHDEIKADKEFVQVVDGNKVVLQPSSLEAGKAVKLNFKIENARLEQYLGALGHVVILDAHAEEYLHVHPADETNPVFETLFPAPGVYKIWAEFKQDGKVGVYPFIVEVK